MDSMALVLPYSCKMSMMPMYTTSAATLPLAKRVWILLASSKEAQSLRHAARLVRRSGRSCYTQPDASCSQPGLFMTFHK